MLLSTVEETLREFTRATPEQQKFYEELHRSALVPDYAEVLRESILLPKVLIDLIVNYATSETVFETEKEERSGRPHGPPHRVETIYTTTGTRLFGMAHGPYMVYRVIHRKRFDPVQKFWIPCESYKPPTLWVVGFCYRGQKIGLTKRDSTWSIYYQGIRIWHDPKQGWLLDMHEGPSRYSLEQQRFFSLFSPQVKNTTVNFIVTEP